MALNGTTEGMKKLSSIKKNNEEFKLFYDEQMRLSQMRYFSYGRLAYVFDFKYDEQTNKLAERLTYEVNSGTSSLIHKYEYEYVTKENPTPFMHTGELVSRAEYVWSGTDRKAMPQGKLCRYAFTDDRSSLALALVPWDSKTNDWSKSQFYTFEYNGVAKHEIKTSGTQKTETITTSLGFTDNRFTLSNDHIFAESTRIYTLKGDQEQLSSLSETSIYSDSKRKKEYRILSDGRKEQIAETTTSFDHYYGYEDYTHTWNSSAYNSYDRTTYSFWSKNRSDDYYYSPTLGMYLYCIGENYIIDSENVDGMEKHTVYTYTYDSENGLRLGKVVASGVIDYESDTEYYTADCDLGTMYNSWSKSHQEEVVNGKSYECYTFIAQMGENYPPYKAGVVMRSYFETVDEWNQKLAFRQIEYLDEFSKSDLTNSSLKKFNKDAFSTVYYDEEGRIVGSHRGGDSPSSTTYAINKENRRLSFKGGVLEYYDTSWAGQASLYDPSNFMPSVISQSTCYTTDQPVWNSANIEYSTDWETGSEILTFEDVSDFGRTKTENHKSVMYREMDYDFYINVPQRFVVYDKAGNIESEQVYTYDKDLPSYKLAGNRDYLITNLIMEYIYDARDRFVRPQHDRMYDDYPIYWSNRYRSIYSFPQEILPYAPKSIGKYQFIYEDAAPNPVGDVDGDGKLSITDITNSVTNTTGIEKIGDELTKKYDVDGNGKFDEFDIQSLVYWILNIKK